MPEFENKVVIVTGSSSGIGASTAIAYAKEGAKVTITGRNFETLQKVADQIKAVSQHEPLQIVGDFADHSLAERLISETIAKFGKLDILVNNAGAGSRGDSLSNPKLLEVYDNLFNLNVRSLLQLTQLAIPHLEKTKGNIVNVSSIVALTPFYPVYGATKAAVDMITKTSAKKLASKGVRVNSVNPGPVNTGFMRGHGLHDVAVKDAMFTNIFQHTPLKHHATGDDIAHLILFVSNNRTAANMTGSILVNDTGMMIDLRCNNEIGKEIGKALSQ